MKEIMPCLHAMLFKALKYHIKLTIILDIFLIILMTTWAGFSIRHFEKGLESPNVVLCLNFVLFSLVDLSIIIFIHNALVTQNEELLIHCAIISVAVVIEDILILYLTVSNSTLDAILVVLTAIAYLIYRLHHLVLLIHSGELLQNQINIIVNQINQPAQTNIELVSRIEEN